MQILQAFRGRKHRLIVLLKDCTLAQTDSVGVAKVLQSEKNAMEILDTMDI